MVNHYKEYKFLAGTCLDEAIQTMFKDAIKSKGEELKTSFNGIEIVMKNKYPKSEEEMSI